MLLIVTQRFDPTVDFVTPKLNQRGIIFQRLNTDLYPAESTVSISPSSPGTSTFLVNGQSPIKLDDISAVWYRRPSEPVLNKSLRHKEARQFASMESKEALSGLWAYLKEAYWVNHPDDIRMASHKLQQLSLASKMGFTIPKTLITNDYDELQAFIPSCGGQVVNKVLSRSHIDYPKGIIAMIYTGIITSEQADIDSVRVVPSIYQEYVPKEYELRVTVVGEQVFTAEIHSQKSEKTRIDWRRYSSDNVPHKPHALPQDVEEKCRRFVKTVGLNFGTIDLIKTPSGRYVFLELNPNGQWQWIEEKTGLPISDALVDLFASAM